MSRVFNLNRYDKIVANDLSLNGTFSSNLGGFSSQWNDSGSDIYFNSGNVGIGTTSPAQKLHSTGRVQAGEMVLGDLPRLGGSWAGLYHTRVHDDTSNVGYNNNAYILGAGENGNLLLNCTTTTNGTAAIYFQANASAKMIVLSSGYVGIGTTSPGSKLDVNGSIRGAYNANTASYFGRAAIGYVGHNDWAGFAHLDANNTSSYAIIHNSSGMTILNSGNGQDLLFRINNSTKMTLASNGNVGIGTTSPGYPLQIVGHSTVSAQGWNFRAITEMDHGTRTFNTSIFCNQSIGTSAWIFTSSDSRIKKDIVEINDDTSLQKIRLLKPSTYKYRDPFTKGDFDTVDGFIAQEVKEVMPHATNTITECIPNIMLTGTSVSDVSNNYIITISTFDTATLELDASGNIFPKLKIYINDDNGAEKEVYVTIKEIVSTTQIKVESEETIPSELYVYGQEVDNMHVLIKDKIFTTGISALQEVDRQQQADKAKIASLETQVAELLTRLTALENAN